MKNSVYSKIIKNILFPSRLGRRSMFGYADSGINFDHIYLNRAKGYSGIGRVIDKILLNLPACRATRQRFQTVVKILKKEIEVNEKKGTKSQIVDLASGPARYLIDTIENKKNIECLCLDLDHRSLNYGKKIAGYNKPILFRRANVLRLNDHLLNLTKKKKWVPNIVMASGFYEYQSDAVVKEHFKKVINFISPGGLFISIFQYQNPNRKLIERVGIQKNGKRWLLFYRNPAQLKSWLVEAGFDSVNVTIDRWHQYVFCQARKLKV